MNSRGRGEQRRVRRRRSEQVSARCLPLGPFSCGDLCPLALAENWCLFLRPKSRMGQTTLTPTFWQVMSQLRSLWSLEEEALPSAHFWGAPSWASSGPCRVQCHSQSGLCRATVISPPPWELLPGQHLPLSPPATLDTVLVPAWAPSLLRTARASRPLLPPVPLHVLQIGKSYDNKQKYLHWRGKGKLLFIWSGGLD